MDGAIILIKKRFLDLQDAVDLFLQDNHVERVDHFDGDGTTEAFEVRYSPIVADSESVYVDGEFVEDTEYDVTGDDTIDFNEAPAEGAEIRIEYTYEVEDVDAIDAVDYQARLSHIDNYSALIVYSII